MHDLLILRVHELLLLEKLDREPVAPHPTDTGDDPVASCGLGAVAGEGRGVREEVRPAGRAFLQVVTN